jgi:hypothetical protein
MNPTDDYPPSDANVNPDEKGNAKYYNGHALTANSEIVFGGVNQKHYEGCLKWHELGQFKDLSSGQTFQGYWDFK